MKADQWHLSTRHAPLVQQVLNTSPGAETRDQQIQVSTVQETRSDELIYKLLRVSNNNFIYNLSYIWNIILLRGAYNTEFIKI